MNLLKPDGKFDYDNWVKYRNELRYYYPRPKGRFRADVELIRPALLLKDVKTDRNPHNLGGFKPYTCFYVCDDWSTIFDIHEGKWVNGSPCFRFLMESNHIEPKGERLIIFCTSMNIWNEPWGQNKSNHFAFFRDQFWLVSHIEFLHDRWKFYSNYPLDDFWREQGHQIRNHHECHDTDDFLPPTYSNEKEDYDVSGFMKAIMENPNNTMIPLIFADWLEEKGSSFSGYIRQVIHKEAWPNMKNLISKYKIEKLEKDRPMSLRNAIFSLCIRIQDGALCDSTHEFERGWGELATFYRRRD